MAIVSFNPDPNNPPQLSAEDARLDAMTPEEIEENARTDPDNPPLTEDELDRMVSARRVRKARHSTGLTQAEFSRNSGSITRGYGTGARGREDGQRADRLFEGDREIAGRGDGCSYGRGEYPEVTCSWTADAGNSAGVYSAA